MALSPSSYQLNYRQDRGPDWDCEALPFAEPNHPSKFGADASPFQARDPPDRCSQIVLPGLMPRRPAHCWPVSSSD